MHYTSPVGRLNITRGTTIKCNIRHTYVSRLNGIFFLNFAPSTRKPHNSPMQIKIMPKIKTRKKTDVLKEVSKEIKTEIMNNEEKYGSPTNLKVTVLPRLQHLTDSGKKQPFIIVDPSQCVPYFVCQRCAVPMGPITAHNKCFLQECKVEDSKKILKRYKRAVQRLNKSKKSKIDDDLHDLDPKPKKGQRVSVQYGDEWFEGIVFSVHPKRFRVHFDNDDNELIMIKKKEDEQWKYI